MYTRKTKNQRGEEYYHLFESYRDGGKVKQRTLLSLGNVKDGKLEELANALSKHLDYVSIFELAKSVDVKDTYVYGSLYVLEALLEKSGIFSVIEKIKADHPKMELDADRGLFSFSNLEYIRHQKEEYIVGLKMGAMKKSFQEDVYNIQRFEWLNENLAIYETSLGEDRYIITWSKVRAERDKKAREDILDKIGNKLLRALGLRIPPKIIHST